MTDTIDTQTDTILSDAAKRRYEWFHNALRILLNIDAREFPGDEEDWPAFRDNPHRYFIRCPDEVAEKLYALMEARKAFPSDERRLLAKLYEQVDALGIYISEFDSDSEVRWELIYEVLSIIEDCWGRRCGDGAETVR